jgi:hypothetical protein
MGSKTRGVRVGGDKRGTKRVPVALGGLQVPRLARTGERETGDNARNGLLRQPGILETPARSIEN